MSVLTEVLKLFKYDPATDGDMTFNIGQCMNDNWDKLDAAILLAIAAAGAYNPEESYAVGDYCTYKGKLRKCSTAIPTGETWTEAHWTTTTVAAELAELSSQLSNRVLKSGDKMTGELSIIRTFTGSPVEMRAYPSANKIDDEYSAGITLTRNTDVALLYFNEHGIILRDVVAAQNREVAFTTPPQEFDLALYDGFTVNGRCFYYKTQESVVHVIGGVNGSFPYKLSTTIGQLPAGFRPSAATRGIAVTNNAPAYIQINTNGAVVLYEMGLDGTPAGASAFFVLSFVAAD